MRGSCQCRCSLFAKKDVTANSLRSYVKAHCSCAPGIVNQRQTTRPAPWAQVAGSHHEKLDGTGYPRRMTGSDLTLADLVMTLTEIFAAPTALDWP